MKIFERVEMLMDNPNTKNEYCITIQSSLAEYDPRNTWFYLSDINKENINDYIDKSLDYDGERKFDRSDGTKCLILLFDNIREPI